MAPPSALVARSPDGVYEALLYYSRRALGRSVPRAGPQTTSLAHGAYLRLQRERTLDPLDQGRLHAQCARAVRRVLCETIRHRRSLRAGGAWSRIDWRENESTSSPDPDLVLDVATLLQTLAERAPRQARVAEMRLFAGCAFDVIASANACSVSTVHADWRFAQAWLASRMDVEVP